MLVRRKIIILIVLRIADDHENIMSQSRARPISLKGYGAGDFQVQLDTPLENRYTIFAELAPDDQTKP